MEKTDFKNQEMDQAVSFEVVREPSRLKKEQEIPGVKPHRKKRRKLTGW